MSVHLITTIICPDRPGIVERLTQIAHRHGANWEQSRMARLQGDFAGIVALSVPEARVSDLEAALRALDDAETTVTVRRTRALSADRPSASVPYALVLSGADHLGIVHEVARSLAEAGVNVEQLETEVVPAPITGAPLFRMEALLLAPPAMTLARLRARLGALADELGVDLDVDPAR